MNNYPTMTAYERVHLDITDEVIEKVKRMAVCGLTKDEIADNLGIGRTTFYKKLRENCELVHAMNNGLSSGKLKITNIVYEKAVEGDLKACALYLNRLDKRGCVDSQSSDANDKDQSEVKVINNGDVADMTKQYLKLMGGK
jgi:predicted DNA-binding protein (UPF0251 family)